MSDEPIDFAAVKAEHGRDHWCLSDDPADDVHRRVWYIARHRGKDCLPYLLVVEAEQLASESEIQEARAARWKQRERAARAREFEAHREVERLAGKATGEYSRGYRDGTLDANRSSRPRAFADQPEQVQP